MRTEPIFYVYEHWRPDTDMCFYVGKGHGRRARHVKGRKNRDHRAVVQLLTEQGLCVEVRMVAGGLTEADSYALETDRIRFWRALDIPIVNKNEGGQGGRNPLNSTKKKIGNANAGKKRTPEVRARLSVIRRRENLSPETRARMSETKKGKKFTPEHRAKISAAQQDRTECSPETRAKMRAAAIGRKASLEARAKMSAAAKGRVLTEDHLESIRRANSDPDVRAKKSAALKGRVFSDEHRANIGAAKRGQRISPEARAKISAARKGKPLSPEHREKIRTTLTGRSHSAESIAKISAAVRLRHARRRESETT